MDNVIVERAEGVATLRLNRPEKLNALNLELISDLTSALRSLQGDEKVRAVVLTGLWHTADHREAIAAFKEKRPPRFIGG